MKCLSKKIMKDYHFGNLGFFKKLKVNYHVKRCDVCFWVFEASKVDIDKALQALLKDLKELED